MHSARQASTVGILLTLPQPFPLPLPTAVFSMNDSEHGIGAAVVVIGSVVVSVVVGTKFHTGEGIV